VLRSQLSTSIGCALNWRSKAIKRSYGSQVVSEVVQPWATCGSRLAIETALLVRSTPPVRGAAVAPAVALDAAAVAVASVGLALAGSEGEIVTEGGALTEVGADEPHAARTTAPAADVIRPNAARRVSVAISGLPPRSLL
jgi:hypothetical protein